MATLGPKPVSYAAHHLLVALSNWHYICELLLLCLDNGLELPSDNPAGSKRASAAVSEFLTMYTRAAQAVTADDGTDPSRTAHVLSVIEDEVAAQNGLLREAMATLDDLEPPRQ